MKRAMLMGFAIGLLVSGIPLALLSYMFSNELNKLNNFKGVNLTLDKASYKLGETIKVTLDNRLGREIFVFTLNFFELENKNKSWADVYSHALPEYLIKGYQGMQGVPQALSVADNTSFTVSWNQTMVRLSYIPTTPFPTPILNYSQVSAGEYRLKMTISLRYGSFEDATSENSFTIYSDEFAMS